MISYKEALNIISLNILQLDNEIIDLNNSLGRICAEKICAPFSVPRFHNSSMDGFALCSHETLGASALNPKILMVTNVISAGDAPINNEELNKANTSCEIMTGAPLPLRYNCIIPIEEVRIIQNNTLQKKETCIEIFREIKNGEFVRYKGHDFSQGETLIEENEYLTPEKIMPLSALGISTIKVKKKIKIAIFSTGKEVVDRPGSILNEHEIYNTNSPYLKNILSHYPVEVSVFNTVHDNLSLFTKTIQELNHNQYNLIISTGAVSKGKWDFIPTALTELNAKILFHRVCIKPGKPILFSKINNSLFYFGLPGNPISTAVGFRFFLNVFIRKSLGLSAEKPLQLILNSNGHKSIGMTFFLKGKIHLDETCTLKGTILDGQESFKIKPLSESNGWIILPDDISDYKKNQKAFFLPLDINYRLF